VHAPGAGIVGGGCQPEISELATQIAQEPCGFGDSFERVKGIGKTAPARGRRHELRHALRPGSAYGQRIEPALLPDEPGEEISRQIVLRCGRRERAAESIGRYRLRWCLAALRRAALVRFRGTRLLCQADSTQEWNQQGQSACRFGKAAHVPTRLGAPLAHRFHEPCHSGASRKRRTRNPVSDASDY